MFNWYVGLPWKLRMSVACALLLLSTILYFVGYIFVWGWAIGVIMLLFAFPNDSERRGYHDF